MRWLRISVACLAMALTLVVVPPVAVAQTSIFNLRSGIVQFLLRQISTPGSFEVEAGIVDTDSSGATRLREVTVADAEGVWIEIDALAIDWSPTRLVAGEVEITRLSLEGVRVSRLPVPGSEAPELEMSPGFSFETWPRAPIAVVVEALEVRDARFTEGVLARPIGFDATGWFCDEGDEQSLLLNVVRDDAVAGEILLSYLRSFEQPGLDLTIRAEEAAGGLFAAYARLPDESGSRVELIGAGPAEAFTATLKAEAENVLEVRGRTDLRLVAPVSVDAELTVTPGPLLPQDTRDIIGREATLIVRAEEGSDGVVRINEGALRGRSLQAVVWGTFDRTNAFADLELNISASGEISDLITKVEFDAVRFEGRLAGVIETATLRGDLEVDGFTAAAGVGARQASVSLVADRTGARTARLGLDGVADDLLLDKMDVGRAMLRIGVRLTETDAVLDVLQLRSTLLRADGSATYALETRVATADIRVVVPKIGVAAAPYGSDARGRAELVISASQDRFGDQAASVDGTLMNFTSDAADLGFFTFTSLLERTADGSLFADIDGEAERMRLDQIGPDLLDRATLGLYVEMPGTDGAGLLLRRLRIDAAVLTVDASGVVGAADGAGGVRSDLIYVVNLPNLEPLAAAYDLDAEGAVVAEGQYHQRGAQPAELLGFAQLADMRFGNTELGTLTLDHSTTFTEARTSGTIILSGDGGLFDGAFFETGFAATPDWVEINGFDGAFMGLQLAGGVHADLPVEGDPRIVGGFEIREGALVRLGERINPVFGLRGAIKGGLSFGVAPDDGRQWAAVTVGLNRVTASGIYLDRSTLNARLDDVFGKPTLNLEVLAQTLSVSNRTIVDVAQISAVGPLTAVQVVASTSGSVSKERFTAELQSRIETDVETGALLLRLDRLDSAIAGADIVLADSTTARLAGGVTSVEPTQFRIGTGGLITFEGDLAATAASGVLTVDSLDLKPFANIDLLRVRDGIVDADVTFNTDPANPSAVLSVRGRELRALNVPQTTDPLLIELRGSWDGESLSAEGTAFGPIDVPMRAYATIPLVPGQGTPVPVLVRDAPFEALIAWSGNMGDVFSILPGQDQVLTGDAVLDLRASGTLLEPELAGQVNLTNGRYENFNTGIILAEVEVTSEIENVSTLTLTFQGSDGGRGRVSADLVLSAGSGRVTIDGSARANRAVLVRRDDVTAMISGDLNMTGTPRDLLVKGAVNIDRAEARLVTATAPQIPTLGTIRIAGEPVVITDVAQPSNIELDISVMSSGQIFVRGRGLDSEWGVDITLFGTTRTPQVRGAVTYQRGSFTLIGKPFNMKQGAIRFNGLAIPNPTIDIVMVREDSDLTGFIEIGGTQRNPTVNVRSDPALPQEEVLPRLLFGRSQQTLTPGQTLALASGLATLLTGNQGPLDIARTALGVDVFQIDPDEDGEATVTVGESLADGVFLSAEQRLSGEEQSTVRVEIDLVDNIVLDGAVSDTGTNSVGITFSRDF